MARVLTGTLGASNQDSIVLSAEKAEFPFQKFQALCAWVKYSCGGHSAPHTTVFVLNAVANRNIYNTDLTEGDRPLHA